MLIFEHPSKWRSIVYFYKCVHFIGKHYYNQDELIYENIDSIVNTIVDAT
jgi:hypothetical protein